MSWDKIIEQDKAKTILQKALVESRPASAYLFWGKEGVGKDALAIEFAKAANCEAPIINKDEYKACEVCHSCKSFNTLEHPNLQLVFPLPAGKSNSEDDPINGLSEEQLNAIKEQLDLKSKNYYHDIEIANAKQIKIASIRKLKREFTLSANSSGKRVAIVFEADLMNPEAANSFLKTLEEPREDVIIILTSSRKEALLPTILSRCQAVYCPPLSQKAIANKLIIDGLASEGDAFTAALASEGSLSQALKFLDEGVKELRSKIIDALRASLKKARFRIELTNIIDDIVGEKNKNYSELALNLLYWWLRDAQTLKYPGAQTYLVNQDQAQALERFISNFSNADYSAVFSILENAITMLRGNVQPQLAFLTTFIKLRRAIIGKYV